MKCPFCNGNEFTAHQVCHIDKQNFKLLLMIPKAN